MTENSETLILENLKAVRASQARMEEVLRSIELRWAGLAEDNGDPPVLLQPDHQKLFTHNGYQVRPGRHVRSKGRLEFFQGREGQEQVHPRMPHVKAHPRLNVLLQQVKHLGPQPRIQLQVLQTQQDCGDVITGIQVQLDLADVDGTQFELGIEDGSHEGSEGEDWKKTACKPRFYPI